MKILEIPSFFPRYISTLPNRRHSLIHIDQAVKICDQKKKEYYRVFRLMRPEEKYGKCPWFFDRLFPLRRVPGSEYERI